MIFSSPQFLFLFLPITYFLYLLCRNKNQRKYILLISSLTFYACWKVEYLAIIIFSIIVNYYAHLLALKNPKKAIQPIALGIVFNVLLLGYFKYAFFISTNLSELIPITPVEKILLPLGISFFTFQQIAFLVDTYKKNVGATCFLDYALFVSFFPQLIAGPIVHHRQMMMQFEHHKRASHATITKGLIIFTIGIFKKLVIADSFAIWADTGYANIDSLNFFGAWITTLSYTTQLYYDFSGYCDMAIGLGLLFNIRLPINFNSPYAARNIQDFWRRWHITLSSWLRDYIYIPLGGKKTSLPINMANIAITFIIGGIWHGAGWNFLIWGLFHGIALIIFRIFSTFNISFPKLISWAITITFVHFTWILFRAEDLISAKQLFQKMLIPSFNRTDIFIFIQNTINLPYFNDRQNFVALSCGLIVAIIATVLFRNSLQISSYNPAKIDNYQFPIRKVIFFGLLLGLVSLRMFIEAPKTFLYFNF